MESSDTLFSIKRAVTGIQPDFVFDIFGFPIANSTLFLLAIAVCLFLISFISFRKFKVIPDTFQSIIEMIYESVIGLISQITGSVYHARRVFPLIGSLFIFIGISNLIGLIPGLTNITYSGTSVFRTPTADFNTTFALAFGSILVLQVVSAMDYGLFGHLGKFFKFKEVFLGFKKGIGQGVMSIVDLFLGLLDVVGELAKIMSLSLRLFGNMYAGEVLTIILLGSFAYIIPSLWLAMNLLSAVVQTVVFGALVTVFYMLAINPEKHSGKA